MLLTFKIKSFVEFVEQMISFWLCFNFVKKSARLEPETHIPTYQHLTHSANSSDRENIYIWCIYQHSVWHCQTQCRSQNMFDKYSFICKLSELAHWLRWCCLDQVCLSSILVMVLFQSKSYQINIKLTMLNVTIFPLHCLAITYHFVPISH